MKNIQSWEKFNEGNIMKASKSKDSDVKKIEFKSKIEDILKSMKDVTFKTIGNDLEVKKDDEMIAQVMFRDNYMSLKKSNNKFAKEFKYTELGKFKKELINIL